MMAWATIGGVALIVGFLATILLTRARRKAPRRRQESATTARSQPESRGTVTAVLQATGDSRVAVQSSARQAAEASHAGVDTAARPAAEARRAAEESRGGVEAEERRVAQESRLATEAEARRVVEAARASAEAETRRIAEASRATAEAEKNRVAEESRIAAGAEVQRLVEAARAAAKAEARRIAEASRAAAEAEEHRVAQESRIATEAEAQRLEEARAPAEVEARRTTEESRAAAKAEESRAAQESRIAAEAVAQRVLEESRAAAEAEARRITEESRAAAEAEERRAAQESRIAVEAEAQRALNESRAETEVRRAADETRAAVETEETSAAEASRATVEPETLSGANQAQPGPTAANERATEDGDRHHEEHPALDAVDDPEDDTSATVDEQNDAAEPGLADGSLHATVRHSPRRQPPTYRPPTSGPSIPGQRSSRVPTPPPSDGTHLTRRAASIAVRLTFERGGFWNVRLLPTRPESLPERCNVTAGAGSLDLLARDEDWYQDVQLDGMGGLLRSGFVWKEGDTGQEWVFAAGRDILVLATGTVHIGFVSAARLALGRQHAVLCTTSQLAAVEHALRQAGCGEWRQFDETDGAPQRWVVLCGLDDAGRARGLVPERAIPQEGDTLDVLRPLPDVEIAIEGGVPLGYNSWLAGVPPAIRVHGSPDYTSKVLIDAKAATLEDGAYVVAGWDAVGEHQVWCYNVSRSYSLVQVSQRAKSWTEYSFAAHDKRSRIAICGPLVRPIGRASELEEPVEPRHTVAVLPSNPVLLGANPGDVLFTVPPAAIHAATFLAYPSFAPVWALPAHPLRCRKGATRVLLVGNSTAPPAHAAAGQSERRSARPVEQWWRLIRDAKKKGLAVEPGHPDAVALWRQYTDRADSLWKTSR